MMQFMPDLKPCPLCGSKAFVMHDVIDDYEMGWSVGCPRACINDNVHKLNEKEFREARLVMFGFTSKEEAIEAWNKRSEEGEIMNEILSNPLDKSN